MSSSITTTTALCDIPKLPVNGDNSVIFFIRFTQAVKSKGIWPHLNGSATCPQPPPTTTGVSEASSAAPVAQGPRTSMGTLPVNPIIAKYEANLEKWEKDEALALDLLTQCILDSNVICTLTLKTAVAMWAEIVHEYMEKGMMTQMDLHIKFLESLCSEKSDVHVFLDSLSVRREELAQAGVQIDEKDYCSTVIKSLPFHLSNFTSNQLTAAHLFLLTKTINPDLLISVISEKYDCNQCRCKTGPHACTFNGKGRDYDEVMAVTLSHSAQWGNPNTKLSKKGPKCWNCGESSHIHHDCKKPKKQASSSQPESANQVADDSDEEAFGVSNIESDANSMPGLEFDSNEDINCVDDEVAKGWFSDAGDDWVISHMEYLITWTELHHRLGCVSPGVAKQFAEKGLVTRVRIDTLSGNMVFCKSCIYTKATQKPVVKVQEGGGGMGYWA